MDVTVLGAGVLGLSCALACQKRGAKVQIVDPYGPAFGASGGIVGALAPHTPDNWNAKKQFQFESLIMARTYWPWVEAVSGLPTGYRPTGRLQPVQSEKQLALARRRSDGSKDHWGQAAVWEVQDAADVAWAPPTKTGYMIKDTLSAHLHPRHAVLAMAEAFRRQGGAFASDEDGIVIEATGWAGLKVLSTQMGREVGNGVKGQAALLQVEGAGVEQIFADTLHIVPHFDGTVAIGSTNERDFDSVDTTDEQLDDVIGKARAMMPILQNAPIVQRWAGVRPRAISRAPLMGEHPLQKGRYIVNGGFKIGFGMAPKMGEVMADLVLYDLDTIPEEFSTKTLFYSEMQ